MASPQEKNGMNGYSNGNSNGNSNGKGKHAAAPQARPKTQAQPEEKKEGVVKSFKKLRVLSKRPLPREMGDGSYRVVDTRPGLKQDVRRLRGKGELWVVV
jgi:linoleate 10R-lipoxygenase